jgi:spore maturation protein CgeB
MKTILLLIESLEPGNLHRGIYNGFLQNSFVEDRILNIIPMVCPRDVTFSWNAYDELILNTVKKFKIDLVFSIGGEYVSIETLQELKKKGIRIITWQIDDPFMLTESCGLENRKKLLLYDLIYTTNKASIEKQYNDLHLSDKVKFMPFGYDTLFHKNLNLNKKYDISFVGSSFPTRQKNYFSKFYHKVNLFGTSANSRISHYSMVEIVNQSKINLNFSDQPVNGIKCLKNRVPEVLGCGQFLLTEFFPELTEMFTPGKELDCFFTIEELNNKNDFYLKNEIAREKIARTGAEKIKKYQYKCLTLEILKENLSLDGKIIPVDLDIKTSAIKKSVNSKLKILIVSHHFNLPHDTIPTGGVQRHIQLVTEEFIRRGYEIEWCYQSEANLKILQFNPNIIISNDFSSFISNCPIPQIMVFHGYEGNVPPLAQTIKKRKEIEGKCQSSICVGEYIKKWYNQNPDKVIWGGVEEVPIILPPGKNEILYLGRLDPDQSAEKVFCYLGEAKKNEGIDFHISVCGNGRLENKIKEISKRYNLDVTFYGFVENPDYYIKKADLIICSGYLSILESFINKRPVLTFYENELKKDYLLLMPCQLLFEKPLKEIFNSITPELIEKNYQFATQNSWSKVVDVYEELFEKCLPIPYKLFKDNNSFTKETVEISACRICKDNQLEEIINLGNLHLTGIFPKPEEKINKSPLVLMRCKNCGLIQLKHTYNLTEMYGKNYGYHSDLNSSMVKHLKELALYVEDKVRISPQDIILDIGSNDATFLKQFKRGIKVGVDPTAEKFSYGYEGIQGFSEFFPSENLNKFLSGRKAKIITSIACFYDLEDPVKFAVEIEKLLSFDGIWVTEQSYLPSMVKNLAYDTICHEHLEYYGLKQIKEITDRSGLKIIDVDFDNTNGGSFRVTIAQENSRHEVNQTLIDAILYFEEIFNTKMTFEDFKNRVYNHREKIQRFLMELKSQGKNVSGYGASTKGNVLLQFCDITTDYIQNIVEVNPDKFGRVTPGSNIPIIEENGNEDMDYLFVLPWHFKENILKRNQGKKCKFIFPLPEIEVI